MLYQKNVMGCRTSFWTDKMFILKCNNFKSIDRPRQAEYSGKSSLNNLNINLFPTQIYFRVTFLQFYQLWSPIHFLFYVREYNFLYWNDLSKWYQNLKFWANHSLKPLNPVEHNNKPVKHLSCRMESLSYVFKELLKVN